MSERFEGFSPDFFSFFEALIADNSRDWFNANKARYEQDVLLPLSHFVSAMAPRLAKISPHYVADPRPRGGSIFRIYRDMRFARGSKPYKEHGACQFRTSAARMPTRPATTSTWSPARCSSAAASGNRRARS